MIYRNLRPNYKGGLAVLFRHYLELLPKENLSTLQLCKTRVLNCTGMNFLLQRRHFRTFVLAVLVLTWVFYGSTVQAQSFGIIVSNQPAPVVVNGTLIYTYAITNMTGTALQDVLPVVQVTNAFSGNINLLT